MREHRTRYLRRWLSQHQPRLLCAAVANILMILTLVLGYITPASAHLMVAQRGTLNLVDSGAFMVLSIPVSAFPDADDDGDGALTLDEFSRHHTDLITVIQANLRLVDADNSRPLQEMLLTPVSLDHQDAGASSQLIVTGQFDLRNLNQDPQLQINLFGLTAVERSLRITATRSGSDRIQTLVFTPEQAAHTVMLAATSPAN